MDQYFFTIPFASLGDQTVPPLLTTTSGSISMQQGWGPDYALDPDTNPSALPIDRATTNWILYAITQAVAALQQTGIPQWITSANNNGVSYPYAKYATVRYSATTPGVTFETYVSVIDNNTDTPGTTNNWQPIASIVAAAADVVAGTSARLPVTPLTLKSYPGNTAQTFNVATATAAGHAVPLAQAQGMQGNYAGTIALNTNTTLTAAQMSGNAIEWFGASGGSLTLPSAATLTAGKNAKIYNYGAGTLVINTSGVSGDFIYNGLSATLTTITLQRGDDLELVARGTQEIDMVGGSAVRQYYSLMTAGLSGGGGAQSSALNVRANLAAAGTSVAFTADEIVLESALGGTSFKISGFSQTLNISGTGAGGMDTGSAPASGYLAVYGARNPTTGAVTIFAQNCTSIVAGEIYGGANAPAGYTQTKLLSVVPTNSSSQLPIFAQTDRNVYIIRQVGVSVSSATAVSTSASVAALIPKNAVEVFGDISASTTGTTFNMSVGPSGAGSTASPGMIFPTFYQVGQTYYKIPISTAQTLYYYFSQVSGTFSGQVNIAGYRF